MAQDITPQTVEEREAARYIGYSTAALRCWRHQGHGPAYVRYGRSIRYRLADLDQWLTAHRVDTTLRRRSA